MKRLMVAVIMVTVSPLLTGYAQPDEGRAGTHGAAQHTTVRTTPSGIVVQEVRQGDVTVTTYGRSAPSVAVNNPVDSAKDTQGEAEVSISVDDPADTAALSSGSVGPTVYEMTLASGNFTPEEACAFAEGLDEHGCRTAAEVTQALGSESGKQDSVALAPIYDSRCYDFKTTEGDGTKWSHNCNVRRIDSSNSSYVWIANQMKATGGEDNTGTFADGISGVGMRADYAHSSATAVDWQPAESRPYSACNERTVTVQGRSGASYSSTSTVCDDLLAPWHSPAFQYFGSKWTGPEAPRDHTRATIAASLHRIPAGGTRGYTISAWLRWN